MSILGTYSFYGTYYNVIYNEEYRSNYSVKESMDIVWLLLCYLWLTCHIRTQTQNKGLVCTFLSSRCIPNKHLIYIVCIEQWTICWLPRYILSLSCYFLIDLFHSCANCRFGKLSITRLILIIIMYKDSSNTNQMFVGDAYRRKKLDVLCFYSQLPSIETR